MVVAPLVLAGFCGCKEAVWAGRILVEVKTDCPVPKDPCFQGPAKPQPQKNHLMGSSNAPLVDQFCPGLATDLNFGRVDRGVSIAKMLKQIRISVTIKTRVLKWSTQNHASRIKKAASAIYGWSWDCPLPIFIYPGFNCGSLAQRTRRRFTLWAL